MIQYISNFKLLFNGDKMLEIIRKELVMARCPTDFCHASTLLPLADGSLLCCWFGGTREGNADVAVYGSRRSDGRWSEPRMLADGAEANWNPVLLQLPDGWIWLFYKEGQQISDWRTLVKKSCDGGASWSEARELAPGDTGGGRGPVRNKVLRLADGRLVAGASTERGLWQAYADFSDDNGASWRRSQPITIAGLRYEAGERTAGGSTIAVSEQSFYGRGVIQPSLWQDTTGVHMLLRSSEGFVYRSDSADSGASWCGAYPLALPNNNSGLDVAQLDGSLYLACNPVAANWGARSPLSIFTSGDGYEWEKLLDLESGPGEFSYPAVLAHDGRLLVSYTYDRRNICVAVLGMRQ